MSTTMQAITHGIEVASSTGSARQAVQVCSVCEGRDPALRGIPHVAYLGVQHGLHSAISCDHPDHEGPQPWLDL